MDFRKAVIDVLDRLIAGEFIEKCIAKTLEKTVAEIIDHELRAYSDFGKTLEAKIKEAMKLEDPAMNIPSYNQTVIAVVRQLVAKHTDDMLQRSLIKQVEEVLEPPPDDQNQDRVRHAD